MNARCAQSHSAVSHPPHLGSTVGPLSAAGGPTRVLRVPEKALVPRCLSAPPKSSRSAGFMAIAIFSEQSTRNPRRDRKTSLSPSGQVIEDCGHRGHSTMPPLPAFVIH